MKILDAGHKYELDHLDGGDIETLTFVKREGDNYPGNVGHYEGTNLQEVIRALIDRVKYLDNQIEDHRNASVVYHLQLCIASLEQRAAERHGFGNPEIRFEGDKLLPTCLHCGHILGVACNSECHHYV